MRTKREKRRGSIAMVLVFGSAIAVLSVGMLRVAMTVNASSRSMQKQYSELQNMSAICDTACYEYIADLMASSASVKMNHVMPGTPDFAVYQEGLSALQNELTPYTDGSMAWVVTDATRAVFAAGNASEEIHAMLLSLVTGREHSFKLELLGPLDPDYENDNVYLGATECNVPLNPVSVKVTLKVKSNTVTEYYSVEGLIMNVQIGVGLDEYGTEYDKATVRIVQDNDGNGVRIYRGENE